MATNLKEYLAENPCDGFAARPQYSEAGDSVSYFIKDERCYAERVDQLVTVYYSMKTGEMVGCKIKGVALILEEVRGFAVIVDHGKITLGMLFYAAASVNPDKKEEYRRISSQCGPEVDVELSQAA